ncbi:hypothetical protein FBUS_03735 [Fasciolopsis buskii]|uniref:2-phosphoxylose phosphatase 1 n=1 Tax=Fasciolopsis buskii TaxID=27845 RepID=A0A8E0RPN4_9TREM|nr:hypothetical protein FBUS_03735 [Fasciolopsis buski]
MGHIFTSASSCHLIRKCNSAPPSNVAQLFSPQRQLPSKLLLGSWKACDSVTILVNHNASHKPSWLTPEIYADCVHLLDWKQYIRFSRASLTRLHGGPLLAHILRLLRTRANAQLLATGRKVSRSELPAPHGHEMLSNATVNHSLVSYFAHDSTLAAVLSHLGSFDSRKPPLASTLIFELHEIHWKLPEDSHSTHDSDPFYVRVIYRNYSWPESERTDSTIVLWPAGCVGEPVTPNQYNPGHTNWCWLYQLESTIRDTYAKSEPDECVQLAGWFHLWHKSITPNSSSLLQFIGLLFSQVMFFKFLQHHHQQQQQQQQPEPEQLRPSEHQSDR